MIEVAPDGYILFANDLFSEQVGMTSDRLVGRLVDDVLVSPIPDEGGEELLPGLVDVIDAEGARHAVLPSETVVGDGVRRILLFDANEQRAFGVRLRGRFALAQRTQNRLELVMSASIALGGATSEADLAEILADTTARAYAAEDAAVFLLDERQEFALVAGVNPFGALIDDGTLLAQARQLVSVLKISGVNEARALSPVVADAFELTGVQSIIVTPISDHGQLLGILAAFFHHPRQFDEQASPLADALAGLAARAILSLRLQQRLEHAAMHDDTTGLPNRRLLEESVETTLRVRKADLAVLFVDLDGFKDVNDQLGHQVGDEILREVANRLRAAVRDEDVVSRYGGDEFVILCEVTNVDAAVEMAERVCASIREPYAMLPPHLSLGASIGVSVAATDFLRSTDRLVRSADQAMYRAKSAGGNRVALSLGAQ